MRRALQHSLCSLSLNESPSEKEGKFLSVRVLLAILDTLNESPSEKEGKYACEPAAADIRAALNESPSEKEGKSPATRASPPRNGPQ